MKIYTSYPNGVTKIIKEKEFYQTEDLSNEITVYVDNTNLSEVTYSLTLEFLRADGRKTSLTPVPPVVGESTTLTEDDVTYDIHKFVLTETQLAVAGALAFTCYITIVDNNTINSRGVLFNAVSNVRKTVTYSTNTIFVVEEDEDDVPIIVADIKAAIDNLNAGKVNVTDIIDDLTHTDTNKPLSAKQGKVLKEALDLIASTTYTKTEDDALLAAKADKSNTYTIAQVDNLVDGLYVSKMYGNTRMSVSDYNGELVFDSNVLNRYVDPTWYHLQVGDKIVFNGNTDYRYWLAIKDDLSDSTIHTFDGWKQETYVANAEVYVRITLAKTDNSNISIDFAELLGEDVITIHTRKPVTVRIGTVYGTNLNSYLYYSGSDTFNHRLRTSVIKFNKGDIINFKEFGTKYEWDFMAWDLDGTFISETLWKDGNVYVVQQDCQAVIVFKKSGYDKSLMLKGNIYFKKDLDGTDSATKSVIVLDNTCVKTGETITISNTSNALLYKIDFLSNEWGQGTTSLQTIDYGTSSATVTANMSNVKNVVITMKKTDDTSFSNIASEILWNIYRQDNITSSLGDKYDVDSIYNVDFEVNGTFEINTFNSNVVQCGHRGWDTLAPENTITSYELAYKLGCRFIEGDVRWTADGVPVLMHDATINRTARNSDGTTLESTINIADITYAEALEYDYGIYQGELYKGTKLPTFDEVMKWCKTRDVYFQIDTTTGDWNETQMMSLFKIVKKYGMLDHVLWESLYASKLRTLYALGVNPKNSKMSFYGGITTTNIDTAYNLGCKIVSIQYSLATYSLIQYALSKGIKPFIWFDDLDKNAYNVFRLFNLGAVGFYNTKITDIYALRWFKALIGYDDNSQSAVTNKEEELLQQAYSDISDLLSDVSTLEQDNAKLKMEVANLKTAVEGNLYNETDDNGLAYEVALSNPLPYGKVNKIGSMSYKVEVDGVNVIRDTAVSQLLIRKNGLNNLRLTQIGAVDLGTLNWLNSGQTLVYTEDLNSLIKKPSSDNVKANISSTNYTDVARNNLNNYGEIAVNSSGNVYVRNNQEGTPSGYLLYELETELSTPQAKVLELLVASTKTIPSQIQALTGYGWGISESVCNYVDYDRKVFVQKVARVDLGSLTWSYDSTDRYWWYSTALSSLAKKPIDALTVSSTLSSNYDNKTYNELYNDNSTLGMVIKYDNGNLIIRNGNSETSPSGYLYYELATPIETDVSQYLTGDDFDVLPNLEPNGSIVLDNTYQQEAMYDITTLEKVSV